VSVRRSEAEDRAGSAPRRLDADLVSIPLERPIWERVFVVAPLVIVGTKEGDVYDLAPKHRAMPCSWENYFAFVCTPRHATYRNLLAHPEFTVSFPSAERILDATFAAGPREDDDAKPTLATLPVVPATKVDGVLVEGCSLYLECELERMVDEIGDASLVVGRVVAACAPRTALRRPNVDDADLVYAQAPLVYLAPGRFGSVRESFSFPFPAGFQA
jgi:flavin reductase (DIM6/NTAB) family NADH-FMN oxidoreductase RutF